MYIYKFYTYSGTPKVRLFFYIWQVSWQEKTIKRIAKLVQIKSTEASCKMAGVPNALQYFLLLHLHLIANSEWRAAAQTPARGAAAGGGAARGAAAGGGYRRPMYCRRPSNRRWETFGAAKSGRELSFKFVTPIRT